MKFWKRITGQLNIEKRLVVLETKVAAMAARTDPLPVPVPATVTKTEAKPQSFQLRRSFRRQRIAMEHEHNQTQQKLARLVENIQQLPPQVGE